MPSIESPVKYRQWPVVVTVLATTAVVAVLARDPGPAPDEVASLASRFRFAVEKLSAVPVPQDVVYPVNPIAKHMQYYFYQVGESAALGDLDGDGLPNDLCQTDVRAKSAMVRTVPGSGNRFGSFTLDFGKLVNRKEVWPSVCRFADMNEDGLTDIFVAFYGRPPLLLMRRETAGLKATDSLTQDSFQISELVPGAAEYWWTATATFADFDGDGHQDLIVGNYYADGSELTKADSTKPFEMNEDFSRAKNGGTSRIFLGSGAGTFKFAGDVIPGKGSRAWTLAVGAADLNRDGLSDLYIANDFGEDQLLLNESTPGKVQWRELKGEKGFNRPASMSIGHDTFKSMSIDFADLNDDGTFDMYVSNIASPFRMQEGHFLWMSTGKNQKMKDGIAPWVEKADDLGMAHSAWSWDARFEDFDNDGAVELVQATGLTRGRENRWPDLAQVGGANDALIKYPSSWPKFLPGATDVDGTFYNPFYARGKGGNYVDLSETLFPGMTEPARGIAVADVDGDGFAEQVYANFWMESSYVKNLSGSNGSKFLGLHLLLPTGKDGGDLRVHAGHPAWREGTPAIGTFVEIEMSGGHKQIRQVDGGNGHSGQRSPELRFGLGKVSDAPVPVKLTWRDRNGKVHKSSLSLTPGYHTVVLSEKGSM